MNRTRRDEEWETCPLVNVYLGYLSMVIQTEESLILSVGHCVIGYYVSMHPCFFCIPIPLCILIYLITPLYILLIAMVSLVDSN